MAIINVFAVGPCTIREANCLAGGGSGGALPPIPSVAEEISSLVTDSGYNENWDTNLLIVDFDPDDYTFFELQNAEEFNNKFFIQTGSTVNREYCNENESIRFFNFGVEVLNTTFKDYPNSFIYNNQKWAPTGDSNYNVRHKVSDITRTCQKYDVFEKIQYLDSLEITRVLYLWKDPALVTVIPDAEVTKVYISEKSLTTRVSASETDINEYFEDFESAVIITNGLADVILAAAKITLGIPLTIMTVELMLSDNVQDKLRDGLYTNLNSVLTDTANGDIIYEFTFINYFNPAMDDKVELDYNYPYDYVTIDNHSSYADNSFANIDTEVATIPLIDDVFSDFVNYTNSSINQIELFIYNATN